MDVFTLLSVAVALPAVYAVVLLLLAVLQRRLIFLPIFFGRVPRVAAELERFHFTLPTSDREQLDALWMPNAAEGAVPPALFARRRRHVALSRAAHQNTA
jgi:hypothetical protein